MTVLMTCLDLEYEVLCQFLSTFYFAAEYGVPVKRLESDDRIKYDGHMDSETYNLIWNKISVHGKDGSSEYLWKDLQEALNKDCRELFIMNGYDDDDMDMIISWDDDKVRYQFSHAEVRKDKNLLVGMKGMQNVKDNSRGVCFDSAVSPATGFVLGVSVLRQDHKSNVDNYEELFRFMFVHRFRVAAAVASALNGIRFCSDRGYWTIPLICLILGLGGKPFGTLKRAAFVIFTYDQKMHKNDQRIRIDTKRGRSCFQAFGNWCNRVLKILAFRSGTGACSLAMTSDSSPLDPQIWEFCMPSSSDVRDYKSDMSQEERSLKAFQELSSSNTNSGEVIDESLKKLINDFLVSLTNDEVDMLTYSDLDQVWFVLRKFAFTSSSTAATLLSVAPYIPSDEPIRDKLKKLLEYAGLQHHLRDETITNDETEDEAEESHQVNDELVRTIVKSMRSSPNRVTVRECAGKAKLILDGLKEGLTTATKESMMVALGSFRENASTMEDKV